MYVALKIARVETVIKRKVLKFDVGAGQNFAEEHVNDLFSEIDPQNFVKCRLATVTATDNSVPQPSERGLGNNFWQIM